MHAAEQIRHEISTTQMAEAVNGIRNVIPDDVFITVGIAGGFTETIPVPVTEEDILQIAPGLTACTPINPLLRIWRILSVLRTASA